MLMLGLRWRTQRPISVWCCSRPFTSHILPGVLFFRDVGDAIKASSIGFIKRFRLLLLLRRLLIVLLSRAFSSMRHSLSMGRSAPKDDSKCDEGCSHFAATHYRGPA